MNHPKMKFKFYLLFLYSILLLSISSCSITGKYYNGDAFNNTSLTLSKNNTFIYTEVHDVGGRKTIKGNWRFKKRVLILNSFNKPSFIPNSIEEKYDSLRHKKTVIIQLMDLPAWESIISINDGEVVDTTKGSFSFLVDSVSSFPVTGIEFEAVPIKKIEILGINGWSNCVLTENVFNVNDPKSNYIRIFAKPLNHYSDMEFFIDSEWLVKRNKIYPWKDRNAKTIKNIYLLKY